MLFIFTIADSVSFPFNPQSVGALNKFIYLPIKKIKSSDFFICIWFAPHTAFKCNAIFLLLTNTE